MHDQLLLQVTAFADAVSSPGAGDLSGGVPTCPEWTLRDLARHLGRVHRRVTATITSGAERHLPPDAEIPDGEPPASRDEVATWLLAGGAGLVEACRAAGPDRSVAGFTGPVPVSFWERRQLHETLVHRLDAELAVGMPPLTDVAPELAADGVAELYDLIGTYRAGSRRVRGPAGTVHVHATDEPSCEWLIRRHPEGVEITRGHVKADVALRGPARALLGAVYGRVPLDGGPLGELTVFGDEDLLRDWLRASAL